VSEKNAFGGGNKKSLYTPMSEDEQEVLSRLVLAKDLDVFIVGWGHVKGVSATFGDLRLDIPLQINFSAPVVPMDVNYFDLELRTGSGMLLFRERQSTLYNNQPLKVGAGTNLAMVWSIAIRSMDPRVVKMYKPGASGLTSRWLDKDTGDFTLYGNAQLSETNKDLLKKLRLGEARVRKMGQKALLTPFPSKRS
jgi:hypothetical protein